MVSALSGRSGASPGPKGEIGGPDGDVVFEKVGWGRWEAYIRGQPRVVAAETEVGVFVQSEEEGEEMDVDMDESEGSESESETDDDMTDEEDWAHLGTEILRQHGGSPISSVEWAGSWAGRSPGCGWGETAAEKRVREEQEAVEALVKLGRSF